MTDHICSNCERTFGSEEALTSHNKSKHPEKIKKPFLTSKQKKNIRNYLIIFLIIAAISGFYYLRQASLKDAPIIDISPDSYNFGEVSQVKGAVITTMKITNNGKSDLTIKGMDTSCGCTSASIIADGIESSRFSMAMHGTNPKNYRQIVKPGESVDLKVYYDPNVHKDLRGFVTRSVFVFSDDPRNNRKEIRIDANQVN